MIQAHLGPNPTLLLQWQYQGRQTESSNRTASTAKSIAEADLLNTTRALIFDVQNAYLDFLASHEQVRRSQASEQALDKIVRVNTARVNAGDLARVELVGSEVALLQYQSSVTQARLRATQSALRLQSLTGRRALTPDFEVEGDVTRPEVELPVLQELTRVALSNRPDLLSAHRDVERARASLRLQTRTASLTGRCSSGRTTSTTSGSTVHR